MRLPVMQGKPQQSSRPSMGICICNPHMRAPAVMLALSSLVLLTGCGGVRDVYRLEPQPAAVQPPDEPWGLDVAIDLGKSIHLQVTNDSQEAVRIKWDDCAYVDVAGRSHRVLTADAAARRNYGPQAPRSIAPGTRIDETLVPVADHPLHEEDPLLPSPAPYNVPRNRGMGRLLFWQRRLVSTAVGKSVGVLLAFERITGQQARTLTARYTIADVTRQRD